jgi:putative ABC transport system substrate-binding protein
MDRRAFLGILAFLAAPPSSEGQQAAKVARIAFVFGGPACPRMCEAFRQGLRDLGYVEGRDFVIEFRSYGETRERLTAVMTDLVALKVDVIVVTATPSALAAKQATTTLPIVFTSVGDPVGIGLVTSLRRPGGNVTGFSVVAQDLVGKLLELLKQAVPDVSRVAVLVNADDRSTNARLEAAAVAARALGVQLQVVETRSPADFDRGFSDMTRARAGALAVLPHPMFTIERGRLVELAAKHRLPTMFPYREFVDAGGLMAYGANLVDLSRRAATYVDKILKGAKPGDLPVEEPTKFDLVINLKAAKALGLTIPPSLLARADQVIE